MPIPKIDSKKCTACETCINICPMSCFVKEEDKVKVVKADECIGCKACEVQCPEECITVED